MLERFTEPEYRHPLDARALLLRVTQGCTWNRCAYCYVSRGYPFAAVTDAEMEEQLRARAPLARPGSRVWFVGSNPLALPAADLIRHAEAVRRHFPSFAEIAMQGRVTDVAHKSRAELEALRDAGIREIFLGIESGDEDVLRLMNKGATAETGLEQMLRLNAAGIAVVPMIMIGAGGAGTWERSAEATASLLSRVECRMISMTGLTVFRGTELEAMREGGAFTEAPEYEKVLEIRRFVELYRGRTFLYGMHSLNPVHFTAELPDDRERLLAGLTEILEETSPEELEDAVSRRFMTSL